MANNYKYWYSSGLVWWTNDVADKPSNKFFNAIEWQEFNGVINFLSVLNSSLTVNKKLDIKYIRILDVEINRYKYFFISNINAEMSGAIVYELELDVWATYILPKYINTIASFGRLSYLLKNQYYDNIKRRQIFGVGELDFSYYNLKKSVALLSQNIGQVPIIDIQNGGKRWIINNNYYWFNNDKDPDGYISTFNIKKYDRLTGSRTNVLFKYKKNNGISQEPTAQFSQVYFLEISNDDNNLVNIYPTSLTPISDNSATTGRVWIQLNGTNYECNNNYYQLMLYLSKPEQINRFGGVFLGPPFVQLIAAMSEQDGIIDLRIGTGLGSNTFLIKTAFLNNLKLNLKEYTYNAQVDRYDENDIDILNGINSLKSYYSSIFIYNKLVSYADIVADGDSTNIGMTWNVDAVKDGFYIYSANQNGQYGVSKETWLTPYQLPSLTNNYNQYISSVMSSTNNGIRQVNQVRDFSIRQSHFNETSGFVKNAMSAVSAGMSGNGFGVVGAITAQFDNTRKSQADRKRINMDADNQLKAVKASFDDKARTLQPSTNISSVDTLIQLNSMGQSDIFWEFTKFSYEIKNIDHNNLISYLMYHYYNGYQCDVTTSFMTITNANKNVPAEYKNMYVFKLNETNLNEYININYNYSIYEKNLIKDIFNGVVRVWDIEPNLKDLENKLNEKVK